MTNDRSEEDTMVEKKLSVGLAVCVLAASMAGCSDDAATSDPNGAEGSAVDELVAADAPDLAPADVSLLFPAPPATPAAGYLATATAGRGGALVPSSVISKLPASLDASSTKTGASYYAATQVVGARLDPCTGELGVAVKPTCQAQLRLVFQARGTTGLMDDGALHAFYDLTRAELRSLLDVTVAGRRGTHVDVHGRLGVHPVLASQGMQGAFGKKLTAKIQALAGSTNLSRVTFFAREEGRPKAWKFGQFSVQGGVPSALTIQTVGASQTLVGETIAPQSTHADSFTRMPEMDPRRAQAALRIENPGFHTPNTIGCVECHQTQRELVLKPISSPFEFKSPVSTEVIGNDNDQENLHFFSYMGLKASVSRRTGNETAAVVERFRTILTAR
jgi:hypothetical protein